MRRWPGSRSRQPATVRCRQRRLPAPGAGRDHRRGGQLHRDRRARRLEQQLPDHHPHRHQRCAGGGGRHQRRQRRTRRSPVAWPPTTATSMTAPSFTLQPQCPGGGHGQRRQRQLQLRCRQRAFQHLAQGAPPTWWPTTPCTDEHGATSSSTLTITLTGTNDAPVAVADTNGGNEEPDDHRSRGANDSDVDDGHVLSYSANAPVAGHAQRGGQPATFDAGNAAFQHLAQGDHRRGGQLHRDRRARRLEQQPLTITLTGTNDAPIVAASTHRYVTEESRRRAT